MQEFTEKLNPYQKPLYSFDKNCKVFCINENEQITEIDPTADQVIEIPLLDNLAPESIEKFKIFLKEKYPAPLDLLIDFVLLERENQKGAIAVYSDNR